MKSFYQGKGWRGGFGEVGLGGSSKKTKEEEEKNRRKKK